MDKNDELYKKLNSMFVIHTYFPYKGKCNMLNDQYIYASEATVIARWGSTDTIRLLSFCSFNKSFLENTENTSGVYNLTARVKIEQFKFDFSNKKISSYHH